MQENEQVQEEELEAGSADGEYGLSEETLREAKNMGWVPKEQFRGNLDHWVEADEFLEKSKHVLPLLTANNKRLKSELQTRDQRINGLEQRLLESQKAIEALEQHYTAANKRVAQQTRTRLLQELKSAKEEDDVEKEVLIQDQLDDLKESIKDAEKKAEEKKETPASKGGTFEGALSPSFKAWQEENEWFGKDKKKTKEIVRIAEDLRDDGNELQGREFFEECTRILEDRETRVRGNGNTSKVDGGSARGGRGSGGGGEKSFVSLPKEAKQACWDDVEVLVGEGKLYKTKGDWEKEYARIYYST